MKKYEGCGDCPAISCGGCCFNEIREDWETAQKIAADQIKMRMERCMKCTVSWEDCDPNKCEVR